jgi:hypothetical protein
VVRACAADRVHGARLRVRGCPPRALPQAHEQVAAGGEAGYRQLGCRPAGCRSQRRPDCLPDRPLPAVGAPGAALCYSHRRQWKTQGCPGLEAFIGDRDQPAAGEREQADLTALPDRLRLEVQYALQCRHDDNMIKTKPATVRSMIRWVADIGTASLLDRSERDWRASCPPRAVRSGHPVALLTYAHRKVAALAEGGGWDNEYPHDTWHMRRLGISSRCAALRFAEISQPWLKDLAKRWTRWRLSTGLEAQTCYRGVRAHPNIGMLHTSEGEPTVHAGVTSETMR